MIIGAGNVSEDQAYIHNMAKPLCNRFTWFRLGVPDRFHLTIDIHILLVVSIVV